MKKNKLTIEEMEPIASEVTRKALIGYKWPQLPDENLTMGTGITPTEATFELYFCAEKPEEGIVISSVVLDRLTGEVLKVEIFLDKVDEN